MSSLIGVLKRCTLLYRLETSTDKAFGVGGIGDQFKLRIPIMEGYCLPGPFDMFMLVQQKKYLYMNIYI